MTTAKPNEDVLAVRLSAGAREQIGGACPAILELRLDKMPLPHALILKKATGQTLGTLLQGFEAFDPEAMAAAVWLALYQAGVRIKFEALCEIEELDLIDMFDTGDAEPVDPTSPAAAPTQ